MRSHIVYCMAMAAIMQRHMCFLLSVRRTTAVWPARMYLTCDQKIQGFDAWPARIRRTLGHAEKRGDWPRSLTCRRDVVNWYCHWVCAFPERIR